MLFVVQKQIERNMFDAKTEQILLALRFAVDSKGISREPIQPVVLVILDGFGINPRKDFNAIANATTPNLDALLRDYPNSRLSMSGVDVGLPAGQMGNSEVGHMILGAGRVVYQDLTLIHKDIDEGEFLSQSRAARRAA